jgi:sortase A
VSKPVGASAADLELLNSPERPFADAPAALPFHGLAATKRRSALVWTEVVLWTVAVGSALVVTFAVADRALFSARQQHALDERLLAAEADPAADDPSDSSRASAVGTARQIPFVAKLEIPSIALSALVVDGVDAQTLRRAVGRIPASSRPGEPGDVALAGHRDTDFRALGQLDRGDPLILRTGDGEFRYEVESIRIVAPQRIDVLTPTDHPTLTLVTCYPFHYVGPAPLRYVVRAREVARPSRQTI